MDFCQIIRLLDYKFIHAYIHLLIHLSTVSIHPYIHPIHPLSSISVSEQVMKLYDLLNLYDVLASHLLATSPVQDPLLGLSCRLLPQDGSAAFSISAIDDPA